MLATLWNRLSSKFPAQGGLTDSVGASLEQMLVAKGLKATVIATACQAQTGGGFVSFVIESPAVVVGKIQIASTSAGTLTTAPRKFL